MACSKLVLLCLLASIAAVAVALPNDLIIGYRVHNDALIQRELVQKSYSLVGSVKVSKTFTGNGRSRITMIRALDRHTNGHGAKASVVSGGVGETHVTMKFESETFRGIDFEVEIYGIY